MRSPTSGPRVRQTITVWLFLACLCSPAVADDLADMRERGVLRHLGIPYAGFVTGSGDGLDVELMQRFARYLGVRYEYVETDWKRVIGDLTGKQVRVSGEEVEVVGDVPVRGDVIANGLTVLPWRQKLVRFSEPTFPSGVWLVAHAESRLSPIASSGSKATDIEAVRARLRGTSVLVMEKTCLDPKLYQLDGQGLDLRYYTRSTNLNEMVPAVLNGDAETSLLDVPDALVALERWPGSIKIIGPVSGDQQMAVAFRPESGRLREAFNAFYRDLRRDGIYAELVRKYYPSVFQFFPAFFAEGPT
ncbi:MAG: transporter substrate-binding domain-containing protein [Gammaproteobacteria bacterium]|jgi:ABC-type amino acid transport substrate-binding protein|nr:transporter substrate-binding domain-containing protein [Gammaproteobacteria bacterium]